MRTAGYHQMATRSLKEDGVQRSDGHYKLQYGNYNKPKASDRPQQRMCVCFFFIESVCMTFPHYFFTV